MKQAPNNVLKLVSTSQVTHHFFLSDLLQLAEAETEHLIDFRYKNSQM